MASVYLCEDLKHDRKVALKLLKPELAAVLGAERFVQEIKTTASMSHPHILPLFDSGTADGFLFYVMPFIEGETLRDRLNRETQLGVEEAIRIAREVAEALDYAHRRGVIHRDIKPENILLHDGRPMVADFGIALAVSAAAGGRMTETGLSLGTPHYMSPEQATAEKEITPRSDVYSLASVLYEMLAGQPPHIGGAAQQVIMKIITDVARPVSDLRRNVPPNVVAALAKALEKLPADRFDSAKAFSDALASPTFTTPGTAAISAPAVLASGVSRTMFMVTAAVALVAIVAAAWGWSRPAQPRDVAWLSLFFPDSQALSDRTLANRITLSPDGRMIAYAGPSGAAGGGQLWIRPLGQLRATPIPGTEGGMNPSFSPDGRSLAFTSTLGRRAIKRVALGGGPAQVLTDSLVDLGGVSWADDGNVYFDGHLEGDGVARVKETGGVPEVVSRPDNASGELYHFQPFVLPRGRGVLFTISRGGGNFSTWDIGVLDTRTGTHKVLTRGLRAWYASSGHLLYVTDGGALMAAAFDLDALAITGDAVAITGGVAVVGNARVDIAASSTGALLFTSGRSMALKRELAWVARDGSATPVDPEWSGELAGRTSLSPDGRTVAIAMGTPAARQVWVKQLDRGPATRVSDLGNSPSWSPDGRFLVFNRADGIWRVPADGSVLPTQLVRNAVGVASQPSYAAAGTWIVYTHAGDIYGLRTDGDTTPRMLIAESGTQNFPTVSPDGRWLAYQSDETGSAEVYVRPFPDTKVTKRQVSISGGSVPRWSRDGRELLYNDPGTGQLVGVPVVPGAAFTTGIPKPLFSTQPFAPVGAVPFDVSPDGKRFLFTRQVGNEQPRPDEVVLVQHFIEELKAKVKPK